MEREGLSKSSSMEGLRQTSKRQKFLVSGHHDGVRGLPVHTNVRPSGEIVGFTRARSSEARERRRFFRRSSRKRVLPVAREIQFGWSRRLLERADRGIE